MKIKDPEKQMEVAVQLDEVR